MNKIIIGFFLFSLLISSGCGTSSNQSKPVTSGLSDEKIGREIYQVLQKNLGDNVKGVHVDGSLMFVEIDASGYTPSEIKYLTHTLTETFYIMKSKPSYVSVIIQQRGITIAEGSYSSLSNSIDVKLKM